MTAEKENKMKNSKEHLDIDLDFLDKKEPINVAPKKDSGNTGSGSTSSVPIGQKYNWKKIILVGGGILVFIWIIAASSNDSTSTSSSSNSTYTPSTQTSGYNTNSDTVIRGDYRCSSYEASRVDALNPTESEATLTIAQNSLKQRSDYLDTLKSEIDNSYVNQYSEQWEIDDYNQKVDQYNSLLASYKRDAASMSSRIDQFNTQVETHNNYLSAHCTRNY